MSNTTLTWQRVCSAIGLVGFLIWYSGGTVAATARYDWCYNDCGPSASCATECENDGGGTITCGDYDGGGPEWCDVDDCDEVCTQNSNPGVECVWESEPTTCYDYGVYGYCGDNVCSGITLGETCDGCEEDCQICPPPIVCGDYSCDYGETYVTCPADCTDPGSSGYCGDGICSKVDNEDGTNCFLDCAMPNERCEDDFDCGVGYTCAAGGEPLGGQCVDTSLVWTFGLCDPQNDNSCNHVGAGFVCREVNGFEFPYCIYWWDLQSRR